mgnify:CR=1 FL=1
MSSQFVNDRQCTDDCKPSVVQGGKWCCPIPNGSSNNYGTARGTLAMPTRTATHQYKAGIQMETGIQTETDIQTETVIQMEMGIQTETKDRVTEVSVSITVNAA